MSKATPMIHYLYHAGFLNDDGGWDSRPIFDQEDNFARMYEKIVRDCAKVAEQWYSDYPKDDRLVSECIIETFGVKGA